MWCGANYTPQIRDELAGDIKASHANSSSSSSVAISHTSTSCTTAPTQCFYSRHALLVAFLLCGMLLYLSIRRRDDGCCNISECNVCLWRNNFTVARFRES